MRFVNYYLVSRLMQEHAAAFSYKVEKDAQRYAAQVSDTTMLNKDPLPVQ